MSYRSAMKPLLQGFAISLGIALTLCGLAEVRLPVESPYQVILDRNPFGLRPPPTNVVVVAQTSAPPAQVNVNLSGITELRGTRRAWMVIPAGGPRTNTTTFSMQVGDPEFEGIKVEQIDVQRGVVQIQKNGVPMTLDFQNHGLAYSGPVAVAAPGGGRPGRVPVPGQRPGVPIPSPAVRTVGPAGRTASTINVPGVGNTSLSGENPQVIPARAIRSAQPENPMPVDPAVQAIQMKVQEMRARDKGIPFPPLPPIPGLQDLE
jgi:hypothetical protein